ncbi:coronin-1C-A-like [Rhopilema esculentum]|uniref:coronin-1C-A-like n=1 Tax=Rhopilema esculentum TaxID=499914 RepID=UPI0031DD7B1C|eukprot:gene3805-15093_t
MPKRFVRESKFRHVFGEPFKKENCYDGISITKNAWDGNYCAVNSKFVAVVLESRGGGAFIVLPLQKTGRVEIGHAKVSGHKGRVLDLQWNPFNENLIASASEDCTVKIWKIPEDGLKKDMTDAVVELHGHQKKIGIIVWHPLANNILATAGFDKKVIIWDVERGEPAIVIEGHRDTIYSMCWSRDGSYLATTCKDKMMRIIDIRKEEIIAEHMAHDGPKQSRVCFIGNDRLLTTGFSRSSERQIALWDMKNFEEPLNTVGIDTGSGVILPFYDHDTNMVYLAGKGDGNIRYFELSAEAPFLHYLHEYRSSSPQRGVGAMPKRAVDVNSCEVARFYKLHQSGLCEPISMIVPRRSDRFQEDLYPLTQGDIPSLEAEEWLSGKNAEPILISLKEGYQPTEKQFVAVKKQSNLDIIEMCPQKEPPSNEKELRKAFYEHEDEIRRLKELLQAKDLRIQQLERQLSDEIH